MISFLKGILYSKKTGLLVIDVNGVGYDVRISHQTFEKTPEPGKPLFINIYHHISENDQQLFGFSTPEEQRLFELLISVKSIGPKLALALLSSLPPHHIIDAIVQQNPSLIAKGHGIGKKSAERIVLELKDKLGGLHSSDTSNSSALNNQQNETLSALESLGYPKNKAIYAVQESIRNHPETDSVSELLKSALKYLQR